MAIITSPNTTAAAVLHSLSPILLEPPTPDFNYHMGAAHDALPAGDGNIRRFVKRENLLPTTVPLGLTEPNPQVQRDVFIDAEMKMYGTSIIFNTQVIIHNQQPMLAMGMESLGVCMRQSEDLILRQFLLSTTGFYNCQNGSNGDIPTEITYVDASVVSTILRTANAQRIFAGIPGELRIGTNPVRESYLMFANTLLQSSLDTIPEWKDALNYSEARQAGYAEMGSLANLRLYGSSQAAMINGSSANGRDVFVNLTTGRNAFFQISQDGWGMKIQYLPPEFSGPIGLNCSLGLSFFQAQAVAQSNWLIKVNCTSKY